MASNSCCLFAEIFGGGLGGGEALFGGGSMLSGVPKMEANLMVFLLRVLVWVEILWEEHLQKRP
jgi:hypothetical protein